MNILNRAKGYLVGPMEHDATGNDWRKDLITRTNDLGIIWLNPYDVMIEGAEPETPEYHRGLIIARENGDYDYVTQEARKFRSRDLFVVDRADFIVFYWDSTVPICGSWEEVFLANRAKKKIYMLCKSGKRHAPLWMFGTIPHSDIVTTMQDVIDDLRLIDSGQKKDDRIQLLLPELR